ncbi:MAG: glycosyltransferase 61 family protein [Cyanobacteriota bacterium]|jgi:hypothetical protein
MLVLTNWLPLRQRTLRHFAPGAPPKPAGVQVLHHCLIMPGSGGLHNCAGQPIEDSFLQRGQPSAGEFPHGRPEPVAPADRQATAGPWPAAVFLPATDFSHFGHLLTETAAWLWPFLDADSNPLHWADPSTTVLVGPGSGASDATGPIARLLGLPPGQVRCTTSLEQPLVCRRVFLPVPSMINRRWIAEHHFSATRRIVEEWFQIPADEMERHQAMALDSSSSEKVYLSRSRLPPELRRLQGEQGLEQRLLARGWRIIHPELLPVGDQLRTLAGARVIAGEVGSAFHLLMVFGRQMAAKTIITLGVHGVMRDPRTLTFIEQLRRQPVRFHHLSCLGFSRRRHCPGISSGSAIVHDRRLLASAERIAQRLQRIAERPCN